MAMSVAERQRARRERLKAGDYQQINVILPPTAFAALKKLCESSGRDYAGEIATLLLGSPDSLVQDTPAEAKARAKVERERVRADKAAHEERMAELRLKTALAQAGQLLAAAKPAEKCADGIYRVV